MKVIIQPEATSYFFDEAGRSRFPLYWTHQPRDFKEWSRSTWGADELEILSLFDALPRKLPTRMLIGAYTESARWATFKGISLLYYFGRSSLLFFNTCACFVEIMVQESPAGANVLDAYR